MALLTTAVSTTAVVGCGDVHFLPSPFTPQNVELVYSAQEHLTIVRWRVDATAPVDEARFELLGPDGYQPVDFSRSLFTGGVVACGDGTHSCAQYVVRGHYPQRPPAGQFRPVRAVHEVYGELPGAPAKSRTIDDSFTMKAFFNFKNDPVFVNLTDAVGSAGDYKFPRQFERALWPTAGVCVADTPPDDVVFHPLDFMTGIPPEKPLTAAGRYCVAIRPVPTDNGDTAMLQAPIATLPEVVTAQQVLNPPIETSPIIYQVVLDLEIPLADRCAEATATIESLTAQYMRGGKAVVRKLPTINLSPGCHQPNDRTVAAAEIADAVKQTITTFTEVHHQYHFLYFNNSDGFLQPKLTQSLKELFAALEGAPAGHDPADDSVAVLRRRPRAMSELPWMYDEQHLRSPTTIRRSSGCWTSTRGPRCRFARSFTARTFRSPCCRPKTSRPTPASESRSARRAPRSSRCRRPGHTRSRSSSRAGRSRPLIRRHVPGRAARTGGGAGELVRPGPGAHQLSDLHALLRGPRLRHAEWQGRRVMGGQPLLHEQGLLMSMRATTLAACPDRHRRRHDGDDWARGGGLGPRGAEVGRGDARARGGAPRHPPRR